MPRPPVEGSIKPQLKFHVIAHPDDPNWDRWYEHHDPSDLVWSLPGPEGGTAKERAAEHERIFARLEASRRTYQDWKLGKRAHDLAQQKNLDDSDKTDLQGYGLPVYRRREIAAMLEEEFGIKVSESKTNRVINAYAGALGEWPTTDTHSI
jgi:hypothetical protein